MFQRLDSQNNAQLMLLETKIRLSMCKEKVHNIKKRLMIDHLSSMSRTESNVSQTHSSLHGVLISKAKLVRILTT